MLAQTFAQRGEKLEAQMKELRAIYQGRSGRYTAADTQKMERLKTSPAGTAFAMGTAPLGMQSEK